MSMLIKASLGARICQTKRSWIAGAIAAILACSSGESPVGPATQSRVSAEVSSPRNYSFSITSRDRTVYLRLFRARSEGVESLSAFMARMFASADSAGAIRLVVDLHSVRGGDSFLVVPLLRGVLTREQFVRRGGLVVIVGPNSFSPTQNAARLLEQCAHPILIEGRLAKTAALVND